MTLVLIGLGGFWVGGTLGMILGGLLAGSKSADLDAAYSRLSQAVHEFLDRCATHIAGPLVDEWHQLRRILTETDLLAGLAVDAGAQRATARREVTSSACDDPRR
jgi:hypothetical protein